MAGSSSNKRGKSIPIDRLSSLPDGILIHILSFLGVKKAAITSVLSKRWQFLWSQLPTLVFREESKDAEKILDFVSMVSRTLRIRGGVHLEKLEVFLRFDESLAMHINSWVEFVSQSKTEDFSLKLMSIEDDVLYELPEMVYSNPSLTRLSLAGCIMEAARKFEWRALNFLYIQGTELPQHVIENVLSSCPLLHTLHLQECWGYNRLEITSPRLHHLNVRDVDGEENGPFLEISAPYVQELDILFCPEGRKLRLRNAGSLVKAHIEFTEYGYTETGNFMVTAKEVYEIIKHVKDLSLGRHYLKVISELAVNGWRIPVSKASCLSINTMTEDEHNITGIIGMLESSPFLEKLLIEGFEPDGDSWDETANGDLDCDLLHLKTVKLIEFADPVFDGEPMLTVARTILERAPILEEMEITINSNEDSDYAKIGQELLTFPRSSSKAVIRLF